MSSSSFQRALPMVSLFSQKQQFSSTSVITSIIQRQTGGISILDDSLGIDWKIPTEHANLSEKDTKHAMLKDFDSPFDINVDLYN